MHRSRRFIGSFIVASGEPDGAETIPFDWKALSQKETSWHLHGVTNAVYCVGN